MQIHKTLQEIIQNRSSENERGIIFINSEKDETFVSYARLYENALKNLSYLQEYGIKKNDELIMQIEDNETFFNVFWACILGGIIPIPLTAGNNKEQINKVHNVARTLNHPYLISSNLIFSNLKSFSDDKQEAKIHELLNNRTVILEEINLANGKGSIQPSLPEDIAFIQFSSGSTGEPKGVVLKHKNLIANLEGMIISGGFSSTDSFLNWMPLTHDMGLIGLHLIPITMGINQGIIPTSLFIRRPLLWLDKASRHKSTMLASPNFGYKYVLRFLKSDTLKDWDLSHVRHIYNGAEPISAELCEEFLKAMASYGLKRTAMYTVYGLAEACLGVTFPPLGREFTAVYLDRRHLKTGEEVHYCSKEEQQAVSFVTEGTPVLNTQIRITGDKGEALAENTIGHIEIKGDNVTSGYYNNPEETKQKINAEGWLDTGDLGFIWQGELVVTGRAKDILFVQGQNFYPHDLERIAEKVDGIELGTVVATGYFENQSREDKILLFVIYKKKDLDDFIDLVNRLKKIIVTQIGIIVSHVIPVKKIPKTTSGKIQRNILLEQFQQGDFDTILAEFRKKEGEGFRHSGMNVFPPENLKRKVISTILKLSREVVGYQLVELDTGFAELGIQSIKVPQLTATLKENFGISIPVSAVYDFPTVNKLADFIVRRLSGPGNQKDVAVVQWEQSERNKSEPVAVIGIGCRFPGEANNPGQFWHNLINGIDAVSGIPASRWADYYTPGQTNDNTIKQNGGFFKEIEYFDPVFFGITPKEAAYIDPQHRLLMEVCWEAMENAGLNPVIIGNNTGVFIGISNNEYIENTTQIVDSIEGYALTGSMISSAAGRLSYTFGFQGPSVALDTACSSSLVAVHQAIRSLHNQECRIAIAGGVNLIISPKGHIGFHQFNALAPDGRCKSFDNNADGYGRSEGCGIVILKPLEEAIRDGDHIYAVITGSAVNHDGESAGFTVPNGVAQEKVIWRALNEAGVKPDQVDYLETHGSATKIGDTQEVNALARVFGGRNGKNKLMIGAVKSNIGHCESAAGMAGLIKTILAVSEHKIPGNLHYQTANRQIPWDEFPIQVVTETTEWPKDVRPRIAGVSSFGITGTNAHLIVQEAPARKNENNLPDREFHVLTLSAKNKPALTIMLKQYQEYFHRTRENVADICYTSNISRSNFQHRFSISGTTVEDMRQKMALALENEAGAPAIVSPEKQLENPGIVFLFTGQGSVYEKIAFELYEKEPVFQETLRNCDQLFAAQLNLSIIDLLYSQSGEEPGKLERSLYAQAIIFSIEYALSQLWLSWGVRPALVCGHSIGEFAAACFSGVFSLEDAVKLVALRIKLMASVPFEGKMAGVLTSEAAVAEIIKDYPEVSIAAINAQENITLSGPNDAMDQVLARIKKVRIFIEHLNISHAFHSRLMEPYAEKFRENVATIPFLRPAIPIVPTIAGTIEDPDQIGTVDYWCNHIHKPVWFYSAVKNITKLGYQTFIEIGGTATLAGLASQIIADGNAVFLPSLRRGKKAENQLLSSLSQLYLNGVSINWRQFHQPFCRQRVVLPNYPFQRKRYWVSKTDSLSEANVKTLESTNLLDRDEIKTMDNKATALSELVQLKLNIETSVGESTPTEAKHGSPLPLIEVGVLRLDQIESINRIKGDVKEIVCQITGLNPDEIGDDTNMLSLGIDSLMLVQFRKKINSMYHLDISLNQFLIDLNTINKIVSFLSIQAKSVALPEANSHYEPEASLPGALGTPGQIPLESLFKQQLEIINKDHQLISQQLEILQGRLQSAATAQPVLAFSDRRHLPPRDKKKDKVQREPINLRSMKFEKEDLSEGQRAFIDSFVLKYTNKTKASKEYAAKYRGKFSDWINSLNFRMDLKELNYPLVSSRSEGSRLWDQDGNEYIDIALGYGVNYFGHKPPFIMDALKKQLQEGFELGPQSDLAGQVAELISHLTGVERVSFCNTGSEAVMTALRIARTVSKRDKIVLFSTSFHGNYDGVLAQTDELGTFPVSPGITDVAVADVIALEYGTIETLEKIKMFGKELAAVLVEPVQSRRPDFQPGEFLKELRRITSELGIILIFDEIVNGFRIRPGGAQAYFGIQADMVTYGKVIGGGMPLGIVAGKKEFLDTVDGGYWNYGDNSYPDRQVTFFAGTFCKHPLTLAATKAVLEVMIKEGPALQERVNTLTKYFADNANRYFEAESIPLKVNYFSSQFKFDMCIRNKQVMSPLEMDLFFNLLLYKGVYTWERRVCYFSTVHTYDDARFILETIKSAISELRQNGFLNRHTDANSTPIDQNQIGEQKQRLALVQSRPPFSLSYAQRWIYGLNQLNEGEKTFHLTGAWLIRGEIDTQRVDRVLNQLLERHESLRTFYMVQEDDIMQQVCPGVRLEVFHTTISRDIMEDFIRDFSKPFMLTKPPLFRACLAKVSEDTHLLVMDFHHIAADGYSLNLFAEDFIRLYQGEPLPPLKFTYQDYVQWENDYFHSSLFKEQENYWLGQFAGELPQLNLPLDFSRPALRSYHGDTIILEIDAKTTKTLNDFAKEAGCTLYMVLFAAYLVLLHKLTGQEDIIVGTPLAAREQENWERNVGMFTNTLVQRNQINGNKELQQLLAEVRTNCFQGLANQAYPFNLLVDKVGTKADFSRNPLFDTIFDYEITNHEFKTNDLVFKPLRSKPNTSLSDLTVEVSNNGESLTAYFIYDSELIKKATVEQWISYYQRILEQMIGKLDSTVAAIEILSESEKRQVLVEFNNRKMDYPADKTFHQLFEEQSRKTPALTAVESDDLKGHKSVLTYQQLNAGANYLGKHLRQLGVTPDSIVGVLLERSPLAITAILGILKAGGAFLPLDPKQPEERLETIIEDSSMQILITQSQPGNPVQFSGPVVLLDELMANGTDMEAGNLESVNLPSDLAYVIYTSGSTGKPKGVMVQHDSFVNAAYVWREEYRLAQIDVNLLQMANFSFDVFCGDLARVLLNGGKMVICPEDTRLDWKELYKLLKHEKIALFESTPALIVPFTEYLSERQLSLEHLKLLIVGSDLCKKQDFINIMKHFGNETRVINSYGVTEATIDSSYFEGDFENLDSEGAVPIGKPLPNTAFYILDKNMNPQPVGVAGELFIGGQGVSRGYLNNPGLTSQHFIPDPFAPDPFGRVYKTGDIAKWLPDGNVEFLGRADLQIKIRGFRIEIEEITTALKEHPGIKDALIAVDSGKRIIAYIIAREPAAAEINSAGLSNYLQKKLPKYMIPSAFVEMDQFPLSYNGKIDIKALPAAEIESREEYIAPRNLIEAGLAEIWQDLLFREQKYYISIYDNFFESGGDSLKIAMLAARIHSRFQVEIPIIELFTHPTIAKMGEYISNNKAKEQYNPPQPVKQRDYYPLSPAQLRMFTLNQLEPLSTVYNLPFALFIEGDLEQARLEEVLKKMIRRHESLRTSFTGVYDHPAQIVHENVDFQMEYETHSLAVASAENSLEVKIDSFIQGFIRPFELNRAPLFRVKLIRLDGPLQIKNNRLTTADADHAREPKAMIHLVLTDMHHIISDGVSVKIILEELLRLYAGEKLPEIKIQYKDYAVWWHDYLKNHQRLKKQEEYWLNRFIRPVSTLRLPYDVEEREVKASSGDVHYFKVSREIQQQLADLCKEFKVTLYMVLLSAYYILFYKHSGQEDIVIGSPVAGRPQVEFHHTVGMFINMLAMRNLPADGKSFPLFLSEVKETAIQAYDNQDYQFEELVNKLNQHREFDKNPLFDVAFVLQNTGTAISEQNGLKITLYDFSTNLAMFDLILEAEERNDGIKFAFWFKTRFFRNETISRLADNYVKILEQILQNPISTIGEMVQFDQHRVYSPPIEKGDFSFTF